MKSGIASCEPAHLRRVATTWTVGNGSHDAIFSCGGGPVLSAQPQRSDQGPVTLRVGTIQVLQHPAALADQLEQSPAGVVVMLVLQQMPGQVLYALGEQGDLHLRRTGVSLVSLVLFDNYRFFLSLHNGAF